MNASRELKSGRRRLDFWLALALALVATLAYYPFAAVGFDAHHDGIMLKPALDVLSGQVLFRDSFTQYGPLTTYLQAVAVAMNPTIVGLRLPTVLAQGLAVACFFLAWRAVLPRPLALVAAAVLIASPMFLKIGFPMHPWSSTLAMFFQSVALLSLVRLVEGEPSAVWAWLLGLACACTFWCRQPVGVLLIVSVAACAVGLWLTGWRHPRDDWRRIGARVLAGGAAVSGLILGHLGMNGALGDWWEQNVLWPRRWALEVGESTFGVFARNLWNFEGTRVVPLVLLVLFLPSLVRWMRPGLSRRAELVWWPVLFVAYWAGGDRWVRQGLAHLHLGWSVAIFIVTIMMAIWVIALAGWSRLRSTPLRSDYHLVAVVVAVSLASLPQIFPMVSANHVFWATGPALVVLIHALYRVSGLGERECALGLLLVFLLPIQDKYIGGLFVATRPLVRLESPAVMHGIRTEPAAAEAIARADAVISRVLAAEPDVEVMLYGDDALYLTWFNNRENPTALYVSWPGLMTDAQLARRWDFLVSHRPVVLLNGASASKLKYIPGDYQMVLAEPLLDLRIFLPGWLRARMAARENEPR